VKLRFKTFTNRINLGYGGNCLKSFFSKILKKKKKGKKSEPRQQFTEEDEEEVLETLRDLQYVD